MPALQADTCVKLGVYLAELRPNKDGDNDDVGIDDCNDNDAAIHRDAPEIANGKDDNCNGEADEGLVASTLDADADGVVGGADCDDSNATVHTGAVEICGDGRDNDCDGVADNGNDCNPLVGSPKLIALDPTSFDNTGNSLIAFEAGEITAAGDGFKLTAGPSIFTVAVPIAGSALTLALTPARIEGYVAATADGYKLTNGRIYGPGMS